MPLSLLTGPANSGKTGEVLDRFTAALEREAVLVVPNRDDVERFEEELLARLPVAVGGTIVTFEGLFELAATAAGAVGPPVLSRFQREAVAASVAAAAPLAALAEPARRPGFARGLASLVAEAGAARLELTRLSRALRRMAAARSDDARYLHELGGLVAAYGERLAALGRAEPSAAAEAVIAALEAKPAAWGGRPVFVYGFDDLTRQQLALVGAVAREAEVTVSVIHEQGRLCLRARERLLGELESIGGAREPERRPHAGTTLLAHLERSFLTDDPERRPPDDGLVLLEAAGARNEVEQAGAEIARLLRTGVPAADVAVIVRALEPHADLIAQVFGAFGIPLAIDSRMPLSRTALGRGLIALVRASLTTREAADVIAYLRSPGRPGGPAAIDALERTVRLERLTSADAAVAAWEAGGRRLWEVEALRQAERRGTLVAELAAIARDLFERPLERSAPLLGPPQREDQLAAEEAGRALADLDELCAADRSLAPDARGLVELLESLEVRRARGPVAGRVEAMSPYRARARRFPHVFVLSLQEGEFPRRRRDDPFLTEEERVAAGLPARADQRDEERYLFYSAISRPTRRLHLSFRTADDDGQELTRSFLVDDVLDLVSEGAEASLTRRRDLSETVFDPADAPTEQELARALAERRAIAPPEELGAAPPLAARLAHSLEAACARADFLPGSFQVEAVRQDFAGRELFGASSLELYAECPFRYFVGHELRPRELVPEADARARGGVLHAVLEELYAERGAPTPERLEDIAARARELLAERTRGTALAPDSPAARAVYRRMESDLVRFLRHDAENPVGLELHSLEASFGDEQDDDRPPLRLDGVGLHGKIDRIDGGEGGPALVRDYKSGSRVATGKQIDAELRLQLPLYMLALRELWGMDPVGGVYHPLGKQESQAPRGVLRGPRDATPVDPAGFKRTDFTSTPEEFEERLEWARQHAIRLAGLIREGHLGREPLGGSCPSYCNFHSICRRERGEKNPEEEPRGTGQATDD